MLLVLRNGIQLPLAENHAFFYMGKGERRGCGAAFLKIFLFNNIRAR